MTGRNPNGAINQKKIFLFLVPAPTADGSGNPDRSVAKDSARSALPVVAFADISAIGKRNRKMWAKTPAAANGSPEIRVALAGLVIAVIGVFPNLRTFRWYEDRDGRQCGIIFPQSTLFRVRSGAG